MAMASDETINSNNLDEISNHDFNLNGPRHGFGDPFTPHDYNESYPLLPYFVSNRHFTGGNPYPDDPPDPDWRLKERLKTISCAIVLCLNLGVDPPDVVKTEPCAVLETWVDPSHMPPTKAIETIGRNLQQRFESLSQRTRVKQYLDPSVEEMRKLCASLRRNAKEERVAFYYNGHGVPKPTASGEIWVFNRNYTQYIPLSVFDIQSFIGSPGIYIWDCSCAGNILNSFVKFGERRDDDIRAAHESTKQMAAANNMAHTMPTSPFPASVDGRPDTPPVFFAPLGDSIHMAACSPDEMLPMTPELPADLFTSCLSSPIEMAVRFFLLQDPLSTKPDLDLCLKIPGELKLRKSPLGELNWIFTAVTDTIAWTTFPRETFKRLFRQDLMVAALFRNFLLAERVMRNYHCTPMSHPVLPPTYDHPLWQSWDLAVDGCLSQLPALLNQEKLTREAQYNDQAAIELKKANLVHYKQSSFFQDQLTAFEVWLSRGLSSSSGPATAPRSMPATWDPVKRKDYNPPRKPPDQLPIVLQVLLSQAHRLRALVLLSHFLDLGPWAVNLTLSIGIFPYVQKLLLSPVPELKPLLIYIWTRICAVDRSCQNDLLKDNGFAYFARVLSPFQDDGGLQISNVSEHRAMCAFILSLFCRDFKPGQMACFNSGVFEMVLSHLNDEDYLLRQWCALVLGQLWDGNDEGRALALRESATDRLCLMLNDISPEVRSAVMFALGTFMGASGSVWKDVNKLQPGEVPRLGGGGTGPLPGISSLEHFTFEVHLATAVLAAKEDASPMVRKELVIFWSAFVREWQGWFSVAAYAYYVCEKRDEARLIGNPYKPSLTVVKEAIYEHQGEKLGDKLLDDFTALYMALLDMTVDPYPEVGSHACTVVDFIHALLIESPLADSEDSALPHIPPVKQDFGTEAEATQSAATSKVKSQPTSPARTATAPNLTQFAKNPNVKSMKNAPPLKSSGSFTAALNKLTSLPSLTNLTSLNRGNEEPEEDHPSPHFNHALYHSPYVPQQITKIKPESEPSDVNAEASRAGQMAHTPPRTPSPNILEHGVNGNDHDHHNGGYEAYNEETMNVFDAVTMLLDEDEYRLRRRKEKTNGGKFHPSTQASSHADIPVTPFRKELQAQMGIILPLKSRLFDWCCEYFTEPQMRNPEAEEPGSEKYNEQMWRRQRNEKVVIDTQTQAEVATRSEWRENIINIQEHYFPVKLNFHQFEPQLITADPHDAISIWDWKEGVRLNRFSNGNPWGSNITTVKLINEDDQALLLTASAEGMVRVFRNYSTPGGAELATSFKANSEMVPSRYPSGLVADWQQATGHLLVGGDSRVIRCWDSQRELFHSDIPTTAQSCLTAITSDQDMGNIVIAGFGDGTVRVYDRREDSRNSCVAHYREHLSWVQNIHLQRGGNRELASGSIDGDIRLWDIRAQASISRVDAHREGMSCIDMHEHASVLATRPRSSMPEFNSSGIRTQTVKLWKVDSEGILPRGRTISSRPLAPPAKALPFNPSVSSLNFHPNEMLVGMGSADGQISIVACNEAMSTHEDNFI
ncbi:hypothetical protein E3P91_02737 [Wallemia ichthyophaga]|nr:hypothetical protein E3P91_02737 [Wallemia ichthyophaga]